MNITEIQEVDGLIVGVVLWSVRIFMEVIYA